MRYSKKFGKTPSIYLTAAFLLILALCFGGGSAFFYVRTMRFINEGILTDAVITRIESDGYDEDETHTVWVEYTVGGKVYKSTLGSYSSSMRQGQQIKIRYLPDDPYSIIHAKNEFLGFGLFVGFGAGLLIAAAVCFSVGIRGTRLKGLREHGRRSTAIITDVRINNSVTVNGRHPAKLFCEEGGQTYVRRNLYDSLELYEIGDNITVYTDMRSDKRYFVDTEEYLENRLKSFSETPSEPLADNLQE